MRITKRDRERAAVMCNQMAGIRAAKEPYQGRGEVPVWPHPGPVERVAWAAFDASCDATPFTSLPERWADAEARLRCGWTPQKAVR